jgi:hypothetical protein
MEFEMDQAIAVLERTPSTLRALLSGLSAEWVAGNDRTDSWSPFDVVGHLIHGELTDWIPRARIILDHGPARPFDPFDRFAQEQASQGKGLSDLLEDFDALRRANLTALRGLGLRNADLDCEGTHPELGRVTLRQLLSTWTVHDLNHIAQVAEAMAGQYRDEVGPWRAYLPILDR